MSDFEPGPGWELAHGPFLLPYERRLTEYNSAGIAERSWVLKAPVPPLPTAPYTVIRVNWREDEGARNLIRIQAPEESLWQSLTTGLVKYWGSATLAEHITGFVVLSEPRAVTAKAVIDEFEVWNWDTSRDTVARIAHTFGVSDE